MEKAGVSQVSARCSGVMPSESDSHMTAAVVCMMNAVAITCGVKSLQVNNRDKVRKHRLLQIGTIVGIGLAYAYRLCLFWRAVN